MDRSGLRAALALLACVLAAWQAPAHPHGHVDQQAFLSVADDRIQLRLAILPSPAQGQTVAGHLDLDGDGRVSEFETAAFARDLLAGVRLTADGEALKLASPRVSWAPLHRIRSGEGGIEVTATAVPPPLPAEILLRIDALDFAADWFLQPFLSEALLEARGVPEILRDVSGKALSLRFIPRPAARDTTFDRAESTQFQPAREGH
ncbi:hypothetical protein [Mangrovicoccus sp. HB161399]|uniref:hypothetical protein n=1 Tax=Mangrovicoccus sp. HB161399 TaxID=2720392 RepID=UPI00155376DF|nr:hypothetical protein [Mangrovicoccus sp. HB161399]